MNSPKQKIDVDAGQEETIRHVSDESTPGGDSQTRRLEELLPRLRDPANQITDSELPVAEIVERLSHIPALVASMPAEENRILGQYELLECIGRGGMGEVYRGRHRKLGQVVAIKVVRSDLAWNSETRLRFEQEMRAIGRLGNDEGSEYVVRPLHADEQDGVAYLVMEFVDGMSLNEIVEDGERLSIAKCCDYIRQAALGLDFAHRHGIIHRDIKPSNLLVDSRGRVRILDLGLARITHENQPSSTTVELTYSGQIMGTPDYMAPEQLRDSRETDARTDIYALGVTLYKLLTGTAPFAGDKYRTLESKLLAIADGKPRPINLVRADVPAELATVVHKMLARNPDERFATAAEVAVALAKFTPTEPSVAPLPQTQPKETKSRTKAIGWLIASGLVAALIVVAAIVLRLGSPEEGEFIVRSTDNNLRINVRRLDDETDPKTFGVTAGDQQHKLMLGKYEVEIAGESDDEFRISPKTIEIVRGKLPVVSVERVAKVADRMPVQEAVAKTEPKSVPPAVESVEKPWRIVRGGQMLRDFKHFFGAVDTLQSGDILEVASNANVEISSPAPVKPALDIRAAKGFRPTLVITTSNLNLEDACSITDCDIDARPGSIFCSTTTGKFSLTNCRLRSLGGINYGGPELSIRNCIVLGTLLVCQGSGATAVNIENTCWNIHHIGIQLEGTGNRQITLKNNFIRMVQRGFPWLLAVRNCQPKSTVMNVTGNVIELDSQIHDFCSAMTGAENVEWRDFVEWHSDGNLYGGRFAEDWVQNKDNQQWEFVASGLSVWQKRNNALEPNSREVRPLRFEMARLDVAPTEDLRKYLEPLIAADRRKHNLRNLGPDWDLIGTGDAYVGALTAAGNPPKELRPEPLPGGAAILIRDGKETGYLTLDAAIADALDGDAIELRSDSKPWPMVEFRSAKPRKLTVRAAPGYQPVTVGFVILDDELSLEGLHIEEIHHSTERERTGFLRRLVNCEVRMTQRFYLHFRSGGDRVCEIVNSRICDLLVIDEAPSKPWRMKATNSCFHALAGPIDAEIERCSFWNSSIAFVPGKTDDAMQILTAGSSIRAVDSHFVTPHHLVDATHDKYVWDGVRNVYRVPITYSTSDWGPTEWQAKFKMDSSPIHEMPTQFDPVLWKLLPQKDLHGKEVDITQFGPRQYCDPTTTSSPDATAGDQQAAKWVLGIGGTVVTVDQQTYTRLDQLPSAFQISGINLHNCPEDVNAGLHLLAPIEMLGALSLSATNLSDEGMQHVGRVRQLARLDIQNTSVTGAGLKALANHSELLTLWLDGTRVSDADLEVLATMPQLEQLSLPPDASDAVIPTLQKLTKLHSLNTSNTRITPEGKAALMKAGIRFVK